jgi:IS4 transposase
MYEQFMELMDKREWDQEELLKIVYQCLDKMKWHTHNGFLLALYYESKWDIEIFAKLLSLQETSDLEPNFIFTLLDNRNKHYKQLFGEEINYVGSTELFGE